MESSDKNEECLKYDNRNFMDLNGIFEFVDSVNLSDISEVLERQINYNSLIAEEGMNKPYGMCVGRILMESYGDDLKHKVIAYAAAGADARMSGCSMPVVINSGSGNQGMAVSIPVIEYAKEIHASEQTLYRALVLANLVSIYQKVFIGKLSAYCGAVSAAAGAVSGIAWLDGESLTIKSQG